MVKTGARVTLEYFEAHVDECLELAKQGDVVIVQNGKAIARLTTDV